MSGGVLPGDGGADPEGAGRLRVEGELATLTFRRRLAHPIEEVWAAITEPAQLESWFLVTVRREGPAGSDLEMEYSNGLRVTGRVREWEPPRLYEYEWNLPPGPTAPKGEASVVRWELTPSDGGTLLVMTHRRLSRPRAEVFVRGVKALLDRLSAFLDRSPMPEPPWIRHG